MTETASTVPMTASAIVVGTLSPVVSPYTTLATTVYPTRLGGPLTGGLFRRRGRRGAPLAGRAYYLSNRAPLGFDAYGA